MLASMIKGQPPRFRPGAPRQAQYARLLESPLFKDMEVYSDQFTNRHASVLQDYQLKWSVDPLHAWSRQWEYPFTFTRLARRLTSHDTRSRVLDAGSGVTFFPYYLADRLGVEITCLDSDPSWADVIAQISSRDGLPVSFAEGDIRDLPMKDESYAGAYTISTLEHVPGPESAISELGRILKARGTLVATLDVSLDGLGEIPVDDAAHLVAGFESSFQNGESERFPDFQSEVEGSSVVTTKWIRAKYPSVGLRKRTLRHAAALAVRNRTGLRFEPILTVYCWSFQRP